MQIYDLIFAFEGRQVTQSTSQQDFASAKSAAFLAKGSFILSVYNFITEKKRDVVIMMPPGLPNAALGVVSALIPIPELASSSGN